MLDKIQALSAPPGHSLTDTPNKWQWEKPPEFTDPNQALDFVLDGLEKETTQRDLTRMMAAGITVEELVTQIGFKGFMEGYYSPDVAELIKPSVAIYLMGLAEDSGFQPVVFNKSENPEGGEVDEQTFYEIMKERNPAMFAAVLEENNENERMRSYMRQMVQEGASTPPIEQSQSFLDVPDNIPVEADMIEDEPSMPIETDTAENVEEDEPLVQEEIS